MKDCIIHSRVDTKIKLRAAKIFQQMGLNMSDAIRIFLTQVTIQNELPFLIKAPNQKTIKAMKDALHGKVEKTSLKDLKKDWDSA